MAQPKVMLQSLNLSKNELQNAAIQNLASAPGTPVTGQVYFDTTDSTIYIWDGAAWKDLLDTANIPLATTIVDGLLEKQMFELVRDVYGDAVLSGGVVTPNAPADTMVDVSAATYFINAVKYSYVGDSNYAFAGDYPTTDNQWRCVILYLDVDGTLKEVLGTIVPNTGTPPAPSLPANSVALAGVILERKSATDQPIILDYIKPLASIGGTASADDVNVKVSAADTTTSYLRDALSDAGDITHTIVNPGADESMSSSIDANAVDNTKLDDMPSNTLKGNDTGVAADPKDLTVTEVSTLIINDAGSTTTDIWSATQINNAISNALTASMDYKGGYDVAANSPDLDTSPSGVKKGDTYTATTQGIFFSTTVQIGDVLIAEIDNASVEADWTIVERNLNTATDTSEGTVELATQSEVNTGTDTSRVITPSTLAGYVTNQNITKKYSQAGVSIGSTPGLQTITHNLGARAVTVAVYDATTYEEYILDVIHATVNTVTIDANGATRTVDVVVIG